MLDRSSRIDAWYGSEALIDTGYSGTDYCLNCREVRS